MLDIPCDSRYIGSRVVYGKRSGGRGVFEGYESRDMRDKGEQRDKSKHSQYRRVKGSIPQSMLLTACRLQD